MSSDVNVVDKTTKDGDDGRVILAVNADGEPVSLGIDITDYLSDIVELLGIIDSKLENISSTISIEEEKNRENIWKIKSEDSRQEVQNAAFDVSMEESGKIEKIKEKLEDPIKW